MPFNLAERLRGKKPSNPFEGLNRLKEENERKEAEEIARRTPTQQDLIDAAARKQEHKRMLLDAHNQVLELAKRLDVKQLLEQMLEALGKEGEIFPSMELVGEVGEGKLVAVAVDRYDRGYASLSQENFMALFDALSSNNEQRARKGYRRFVKHGALEKVDDERIYLKSLTHRVYVGTDLIPDRDSETGNSFDSEIDKYLWVEIKPLSVGVKVADKFAGHIKRDNAAVLANPNQAMLVDTIEEIYLEWQKTASR